MPSLFLCLTPQLSWFFKGCPEGTLHTWPVVIFHEVTSSPAWAWTTKSIWQDCLATWGGSPGHRDNLVLSTPCCHHCTCYERKWIRETQPWESAGRRSRDFSHQRGVRSFSYHGNSKSVIIQYEIDLHRCEMATQLFESDSEVCNLFMRCVPQKIGKKSAFLQGFLVYLFIYKGSFVPAGAFQLNCE